MPNYITRSGLTLSYKGSPWKGVGINCYQLGGGYDANSGGTWATRAQIDASLDQLLAVAPINVIRTFFLQETYTVGALVSAGGDPYASGTGPFTPSWQHFDDVIASCKARNLKLVVCLTAPRVRSAVGNYGVAHLQYFQTDYKTWVSSPSNLWPMTAKAWIAAVCSRYSTEDAIAAWELFNEANATNNDGSCTEATACTALRAFYDDLAATVKANDTNHLVSSGSPEPGNCGMAGTGQSPNDWGYIHAGANIDFLSLHDYQHENESTGYAGSEGFAARTVPASVSLSKPVLVGEFGVPVDIGVADGSHIGGSYSTANISAATLHRQALLSAAKLEGYLSHPSIGIVCPWGWQSFDGYGIFPAGFVLNGAVPTGQDIDAVGKVLRARGIAPR